MADFDLPKLEREVEEIINKELYSKNTLSKRNKIEGVVKNLNNFREIIKNDEDKGRDIKLNTQNYNDYVDRLQKFYNAEYEIGQKKKNYVIPQVFKYENNQDNYLKEKKKGIFRDYSPSGGEIQGAKAEEELEKDPEPPKLEIKKPKEEDTKPRLRASVKREMEKEMEEGREEQEEAKEEDKEKIVDEFLKEMEEDVLKEMEDKLENDEEIKAVDEEEGKMEEEKEEEEEEEEKDEEKVRPKSPPPSKVKMGGKPKGSTPRGTHRMPDGTIMTGEVHSDSSKPIELEDVLQENIIIPEERLGVEGKTIKDLLSDIRYFLNKYPTILKEEAQRFKKANKKSLPVLKDIHNRIVAILNPVPEQKPRKTIGIILDAEKYLDDKINEILASKTIDGLKPTSLVEITEQPKKLGREVGSYAVVKNRAGKPAIQRLPVYRAIPSTTDMKPTTRKGRITQASIKFNSGMRKVDIAKMEMKNDPFSRKQKSNRFDIVL